MPPVPCKATVAAVRKLTNDVRELSFCIHEPADFSFLAGQYLNFRVHDAARNKQVSRLYSICSPPSEKGMVRIVYNHVGGPGTAFLSSLTTDAGVEFKAPFGKFLIDQQSSLDIVFAATGTGIGPFRGMLLEHLPHIARKVTLLWGLRQTADVYYQDELAALAKQYPNFRYHICLSKADTSWSGTRGRITQHFPELFPDVGNIEVYACGNDAMIQDIKAMCDAKGGCPFYREVYF